MVASSTRSPPIRSRPSRVILFERWESQAALDAHLAAPAATTTVTPRSASIMLYEVASERSLR